MARLKTSLDRQTFQDYELILCTEEGNLVELKEKGWRKSSGEILVWVDDDIECGEKWLENICTIFDTRSDVVGVSGPTPVSDECRKNRDVFKGGFLKVIYNLFFLEGKVYLPGRITRCGANTLGANYNTKHTKEPQFVDFLEPPHFAIRRSAVEAVGGFDLSYVGVAEWCDVDLCYRVKRFGKLLFHPQVKVWHYPIKDSTTAKRRDTASRYTNYCRFADRYVQPSLKNKLYRLFLRLYFTHVAGG